MNDIVGSVSSLFSSDRILWFIFGAVAEYVFLKFRCKYLDRRHPEEGKHTVKFKRVYIVWALVFIVIGGITYKTQVTYDQAQATYQQMVVLTKQTQDCSRQFNAALKSRADINTEESKVNARFQDATFDRTFALNNLLKKFPNAIDAGYLQAKSVIDDAYSNKMEDIFQDRKSITDRRATVGYPEPTCGHA